LTRQHILIKNPIYRFSGRKFFISDITEFEIGNPGMYNYDYIRIMTRQKKSKRYVIDLIDPRDYMELLQKINEMGIKVKVKGNLKRSGM